MASIELITVAAHPFGDWDETISTDAMDGGDSGMGSLNYIKERCDESNIISR